MKTQLLKTSFLIIWYLFSHFGLQGQESNGHLSIYFDSGKFALSSSRQQQLDSLSEALERYPNSEIKLIGRADRNGDEKANLQLSENRIQAVKAILENHGFKVLSIQALGEKSPIRTGNRPADLAINRSVEIQIKYSTEVAKPIVTEVPLISPIADTDTTTIDDLLARIRKPDQIFCINIARDTILRCKDGTIFNIPAGSLKMPPSCHDPCVTLRVREAYSTSTQIMDHLHTQSDDEILSTAGMLYAQAEDCQGKEMKLESGKEIAVFIPVSSLGEGYLLFNGDRAAPKARLNWHLAQPSVLGAVNSKELYCTNLREKPCRFFFCKIKNFARKILPNKKRQQKRAQKAAKIQSNLDACQRFTALVKKYGILQPDLLREALFKDLVESGGYKSFYEMVQKIEPEALEERIAKYRQEEKASPVLQFNAFSSSSLGWYNIDRYMKYPPTKVTKVIVNTFPDSHTRCLMLVPKDHVLAEAYLVKDSWIFPTLPKSEKAILVVMRYLAGKAYYFQKELIIEEGPWDVKLEEIKVDGLGQQLADLDDFRE